MFGATDSPLFLNITFRFFLSLFLATLLRSKYFSSKLQGKRNRLASTTLSTEDFVEMENSLISDVFQQEPTFEYLDDGTLVSTGPTTPIKQRQILISVDISPDKFLQKGSKPVENTLKDRMTSPKNTRFEIRQGSPVASSNLEVLLVTIGILILIMTTMLAIFLAVMLPVITTVMFVMLFHFKTNCVLMLCLALLFIWFLADMASFYAYWRL
ncbi:hypothetical protein CDAR_80881 [Caerostris darwini]|uniref:Uncharacterized protein n=1 Tax=Caerostris darwini TaxID=1538125 RepID=A0AAV4S9M2_9ARAC|nr:hypothetical protein CDAR_80881 [Caerostris darwini]